MHIFRTMISVNEAKKIIKETVLALPPVTLELKSAVGMVLAEDVFATQDIPAFPQSSMDGYALKFSDWQNQQKIIAEGEMPAGKMEKIILGEQRAVRIFTGAPVPERADTVVMQEKTIVENGELIIRDEYLEKGSNVRRQGSEIKKGALAMSKGNYLGPAASGFLAGIGATAVSVYSKPLVTIIVTGNELRQPGAPLKYGEVYESNSFSLVAALAQLNIDNVKIISASDDLTVLNGILSDAITSSDLVLLTGGVSVGDYDFVLQASEACGVAKLFHKVRQRPGKPLFFGQKENKIIFGLPGNPSSVLTCFYEYVVLAIENMTQRKNIVPVLQVPLAKRFNKTISLAQFLKGYYDGVSAAPLNAQESYRMSSYSTANCLIKIDEEVKELKEGEIVEIHLI
jgi:molybdopterin molybdotransferase